MATGSDELTNTGKLGKTTVEVRHQLADAAKAYNWQKTLEILNEHPVLINATRPGGQSLYTPLHQAAHGNAPPEVIQQMLAMGAFLLLRNVKNEKPVDIAKKKGYQHLVPLLEPVQETFAQTSPLYFLHNVTKAQSICALRFQGYKYEQSIDISVDGTTGRGLTKLIKPVVEELILHSSNNDNFAAFFGLQRFLHKWGGEYLTKYSEEHIAYDFLFLHLYSHQPPESFRHDEYCLQWQREVLPKVESIAATVRKSFRRVGSGEKIRL